MHDSVERQPKGRGLRRRVHASLAVACGVHSAVLLAIWVGHASRPTASDAEKPISLPDESLWDLDALIEEPLKVPLEQQAPPPLALGTRGPVAPSTREQGPPPSDLPTLREDAPPQSESSGEKWSFSPLARRPIDLALGSARASQLTSNEPDRDVTPPADERPSTTGGLIEALDGADVKRGMGRGGPIKVAIEEVVRGTDAPNTGNAIFDITVEASGARHVRLVSVSSEFERWNHLIAAIQAGLARKRVNIPPGARGLHVIVEVEVHEQFPDGTSPTSLGPSLKVAPEDTLTHGELPVRARYRGKVCEVEPTVMLQQPETIGEYRPRVSPMYGLKGRCSPENIGVPARRVVSSRITRETRL